MTRGVRTVQRAISLEIVAFEARSMAGAISPGNGELPSAGRVTGVFVLSERRL